MKVALDYREAAVANRAGKGEHIYQLTKSILESDSKLELVLLISPGQKLRLPQGKFQTVEIPASGALWHVLVVLWLSIFKPVDLYFATASVIIPSFVIRVPVVTTLFDFTTWRFPKTHYAHAHWIEKMFMSRALRRSKALIAISEFTKQEAIELFNIEPEKITVTPLGVDTNFFKPQQLSAEQQLNISTKYNLPAEFILCLATIEPRKNMIAAIESFRRISKQFPDLKLVLAGGKGWHATSIIEQANGKVIFTGYIDDQDRPAIYSLAKVFVFPSLYEGFGLPPLEAMACGTPTVVSDRASLPEVAGKIATQVSLEQPKQLDEALIKYLSLEPAQKKEWQIDARAWSKKFSWSSTAKQTIEVLTKVR